MSGPNRTAADHRSQATKERLYKAVQGAYEAGVPPARIMARFNLMRSEFEDIAGVKFADLEQTGRNPITGY